MFVVVVVVTRCYGSGSTCLIDGLGISSAVSADQGDFDTATFLRPPLLEGVVFSYHVLTAVYGILAVVRWFLVMRCPSICFVAAADEPHTTSFVRHYRLVNQKSRGDRHVLRLR